MWLRLRTGRHWRRTVARRGHAQHVPVLLHVPASSCQSRAQARHIALIRHVDVADAAGIDAHRYYLLDPAGRPEMRHGEVVDVHVGRDDLHLTEMGAPINARMGLNTWAAFYGSDADAVVAGDVTMRETEVTPVLKALRTNGINVVAIHQHMTGTEPTVYFLHYWGTGPAQKLATGVKAALDQLGPAAAHQH